ncbi:glycosyl transferase family 2 [Anaerobacterium chartisolvens]|uniref:Glycosyl transferase family 2 n=1 Tax=Anaerobacterium chartisolvens TaxID=1297424 RepID=A0A369ATY6_9FIRM|nr:glycosyltransferase family 2 protein [Anaerobacterium chartisolvens]RCX12545.1 glycosyl transferase family 2 [Anaerobacterium chartisolvens]
MKTDFLNGTATFVMAHWRKNDVASRLHLEQAIQGILAQTDENWQIVIVDDLSPDIEAREYLTEIKELRPDKIHVILKETNDGPGICRNAGIEWAYLRASPIILFNDADDISHPERLKAVRRIFVEDSEACVVYSTFKVIDEDNNPVEERLLTQSILEILEGHRNNPVQGSNAWMRIGTEKGYTNLTSSTAVKTETAYKYPFPPQRVSEDQHAWLRYSAGGGKFIYCESIPSMYRIPQGTPTVSRARIEGYYSQKAAVDTEGFLEAMRIHNKASAMGRAQKEDLLIKFYVKLAETLGRENENRLAAEQLSKACKLSASKALEVIESRGLKGHIWARESALGELLT